MFLLVIGAYYSIIDTDTVCFKETVKKGTHSRHTVDTVPGSTTRWCTVACTLIF